MFPVDIEIDNRMLVISRPWAYLQHNLSQINKNNWEDASNTLWIPEYFLESENKTKDMVQEIICIMTIRETNLDSLSRVISCLFKTYNDNVKLMFQKCIYDIVFCPIQAEIFKQKIPHIIFLKTMMKYGVAKMEDIVQRIKMYPKTHKAQILCFFCYFAQDIYEYSVMNFLSMKEEVLGYRYQIETLKRISNNFDEYEANNFLLLNELLEYGWPKYTVEWAIKYDDMDLLHNLYLNPCFSVNKTITESPFAHYPLITRSTTLIQFAAYFNSVDCFKFLLINKANIRHTQDYAVAGGNLDIVHICDNQCLSFDTSVEFSIHYRRFDIFLWLLNQKSNTEQSMDILNMALIWSVEYNNVKTFFYCIGKGANINTTDPNGVSFLFFILLYILHLIMDYFILFDSYYFTQM